MRVAVYARVSTEHEAQINAPVSYTHLTLPTNNRV